MPKLVENAGGELIAGYTFKRVRWCRARGGTITIGGRVVGWQLAPDGVTVTHPAADPGAGPLAYLVPTITTVVPSGGVRRWWECPGCRRRADALYLPDGRDRLGCRRCCGLTYKSQQSAKRVTTRKERPALWTESHYQRWEFEPVKRRIVLVADRLTRRRV